MVFTRTEEDEFIAKSEALQVNPLDFSLWYDHLLASTLRETDRLSLPTYVTDTTQQVGDSFGERISHAIQQVFDNGYDSVIVLGNDCPTLSLKEMSGQIAALQAGESLIGPDYRGGVYALGIHKSQFDFKAFQALPWQTSDLYGSLCDLFQYKRILSRRRDVNTERDFYAVRYEGSDAIKGFIFSILEPSTSGELSIEKRLDQCYRSWDEIDSDRHRGPPEKVLMAER